MRTFNKIWLVAAVIAAMSCTESTQGDFQVDKPESIAKMEPVNKYDALKSYVDRAGNPNFKLGAAVDLTEYNKKEIMYRIANNNFDEIVAGYGMKHGAVVQADGSLNLAGVVAFLGTAESQGISVYGHTLCWHSNQNAKYLNSKLPGGHAMWATNPTVKTNGWEVQIWYQFAANLEVGSAYVFSADVKADKVCQIGSQSQKPTSGYVGGAVGNIPMTTSWSTYTNTWTVSTNAAQDPIGRIYFDLGSTATTFYFDNMSLQKKNSDGSLGPNLFTNSGFETGVNPWSVQGTGATHGIGSDQRGSSLSDEEKKVIVGNELERWMKEMLEACRYVKAWDVVNEPMSDWPDASQLKTGVGKELAADEFYWQDYLGKDYAVTAFNLARQYGNPGDKLFINDYNLESNLDKCRGLIQYVEYIESKGAHVDGIGTQMHISVDSDKAKIAEMFTLLAATGKLVKITELDMGIRTGVTIDNVTESDLKEQAKLYEYVVKTYFEKVPAAQRYGITQWCPLDSPKNSSWRAGEPVGLWTLQYNRKYSYAGFANGLAGRDVFPSYNGQ